MDIEAKKPTTLRQVAKHAGVSAATASLVLNGKGDISDATRDRVMQAVEELNYTPRSSRPRAAESTNTIRFLKVARHGQTVNRDHNHFISDYIDGMSYEALRRDYALQVVSAEQQPLDGLLAELEGTEPRGLVVLGTELSVEDIETVIARAPLPTVLIDTYHPFLKANFVDMDNDQLVYTALAHLVSRGFRRIGYVGSHSDVMNFRLRETGFRRAAAALGRLHQRMEYAWGLHHAPPPVRLLSRLLEVLEAAEAEGREPGAAGAASTADAAAAEAAAPGPEAAVRAELLRAFTNPAAGLDVFEAAESVAEAAGRAPSAAAEEEEAPGRRLGSALRDFCTPDQLADVLEERLQRVEDAARDLDREEEAARAALAAAAEGSEGWVRAVARQRDLREVRADLLRISGQLDLLHEVTCEHLGRLHM